MIGRRRCLAIAAAMAVTPGFRPRAAPLRWTGPVLGAQGAITLAHPDRAEAERLLAACLDEVERLEAVFSLYRPDSELARLNRDGVLEAPSQDLRLLLGESLRLAAASGGAFDPTVQPLWRLYATHFTAHPDDEDGPDPAAIDAARRLADYGALAVTPERVALTRPGMALTLNGIAQGHIADRVADLLRREGMTDVLLDLGEFRALGHHPDGTAWRVGIRTPPPGHGAFATIPLAERALATSGGYGTPFSRSGRFHHLLDPSSGRPVNGFVSVSVIARSAAAADGLSTAVAVMPPAAGLRLLRDAAVQAVLMRADGSVLRV